MPTSREGDVIGQIKQAQRDCERARQAYGKGGGVEQMTRCDRRLAELQQELWRVQAGLATDHDRRPR
ncbi:hypothetical protein [Bradyrhizobium sp. STM 3843]|uniref:hypothetical protein n=1 Tax=Bradyrhizobium sp. STM 3843 TaxID=551947 RepID=UPI0011125CF7|nr:hypothetical protein [Bradyrhizobium sp. STM 3843]